MSEDRIQAPPDLWLHKLTEQVDEPLQWQLADHRIDDNSVRYVRADIAEQRIAELEAALQEILDEYIPPCNCSVEYTSREMEDPNCQYHRGYTIEIEALAYNAINKGET